MSRRPGITAGAGSRRPVSPPQPTPAALILPLAVPLALAQLAQVALGSTQLLLLGQLGSVELAAGGLALALFNLVRTLGTGLLTPLANLAAEAQARLPSGAGRQQALRQLCRAGLAWATLLALGGGLLLHLAVPLLIHLGQPPAVVDGCVRFLALAAPGLWPLLAFQVLRLCSVGLRRPAPMLAITLGGAALHLPLAWWLMGRLPGLSAVAWAGTLTHGLALAALWAMLRRESDWLSLWPRRDDVPSLALVGRLGAPLAAAYASEAAFFAVLGLLAGRLGADALAAHVLLSQLVYVVFMCSVGLSQGMSVCLSAAWARADTGQVRRLARAGLGLGGLLMAGFALLYGASPESWLRAGLPAQADAAANLLASLLWMAAAWQFFDCAQNLALGALRAVGGTNGAVLRTLAGYWLVGLPLALLLGDARCLGLHGVWWGLGAGLACTAALLWMRFWRLIALVPAAARLATDGSR